MNTSEFAKLCKVSKRTIIHYDNIGLITPYRILENGYREYNVAQLQKMDTIKIFQKAGYSLNEIKEIYMSSADEIERHLQNANKMLREKIAEYEKMSRYIENKLSMYEEYKRNGEMIIRGQYEVAQSYVSQNDDNHFFSFLQDEYSEFSMINSENQIFIQKNEALKMISGYAFFIRIKSDNPSILPEIQKRLNEMNIDDPGEYFISIIPHALIEDSEQAIVRVIIKAD